MQTLDPELWQRAGRGDRDAFAVIVRTHLRLAFATALSIVGDPADAEDVVQDAFIRCWQRLGQCRDARTFPAWLRSVVRSVALNRLEREALRATDSLDTVHAPAKSSPEIDLDRRLLADRLSAAMKELTSAQSEVLLLHDLEGFPHTEIAELLDISQVMSRKHLSNARRRMRRTLGDQDKMRMSL